MPKSLAQKMANRRYRDKVYDQITVEVPKGKRDEYKAAAKDLRLTFKALIQAGVEEYIQNHGGEVSTPTAPVVDDKLPAGQRRLVEEFNRLPSDARRQLVKFLQALNAENHDAK